MKLELAWCACAAAGSQFTFAMFQRLVHYVLTLFVLTSLIFGNSGTGWGSGSPGAESGSSARAGAQFMSVLRMSSNAETLCPQLVADSRTSSTGNFSSPAWPAPYPPDAVCFYRLQGVPWEGVKLTFLHFELEPPYSNAGCLSDYLEVTTIDVHEQRTFRGRYCGRGSIPEPLLFLDPIVELVFRSNHAVHHGGFFATYEFIDEAYITPPTLNGTSPCGGVVTGIGGVITSPGYPLGYSAGLDCLWLIRVPYQHAIYLRVHQLEFQGSIANCQKAQIGMYDGYEYALEDNSMTKRFCGDLRYYKNEEDRVLLSNRNRLLIRFTTTEPSKPASPTSSSGGGIGFRLIWSDVEFNSLENCTRRARFPCQESRFCFTKNHIGGASNCPDLRHFCISNQLVCDSVQHCGEGDSSDEQGCHKAPLIVTLVAVPLTLLFAMLTACFVCQKMRANRQPNGNAANGRREFNCCRASCYWDRKKSKKKSHVQQRSAASSISSSACFVKHDLLFPPFHPHAHTVNMAPLPRVGSGKQQRASAPPDSPGESDGDMDVLSPASGFSDTECESELGSASGYGGYAPPTISYNCPTHGPFRFVLPPNVPPLPVLQEEYDYYYDEEEGDEYVQSDTNTCNGDEEGASTVSASSQNSNNGGDHDHEPDSRCGGGRVAFRPQRQPRFDATRVTSPSDARQVGWRIHPQSHFQNNLGRVGPRPRPTQRGFLQRADAVWSDNGSVGSTSPGGNSNVSQSNICPRCNCSVVGGSFEERESGSGPKMQKQDSMNSSNSAPESQQQQQQREWRGGMSQRLVGVPSLVRQRSDPPPPCIKPHQVNRGNQADSGIDMDKVTSFDSTTTNSDNSGSKNGSGSGGGAGAWKQSRTSVLHSSVSTTSGGGGGHDVEKSINTASGSPGEAASAPTMSNATTDV